MNDMNNDIIKLDALDRQEALRYLGMGKTEPDDNTQRLLDECEKLILEAARPQYVYRCFECTGKKVLKRQELILSLQAIQLKNISRDVTVWCCYV